MAFINLLNGSYSGVMGQTVGVKHNKKPVVRSRVFSKAPMTEAQKTALDKYTVYNQKISPIIRVLLDSGAVKDKSATAWAYYRRLFKYAMTYKGDYPNWIMLAPPPSVHVVESGRPNKPSGSSVYNQFKFYFTYNYYSITEDLGYWALVQIDPIGDARYPDNAPFICKPLIDNDYIELEPPYPEDYMGGCGGIIFKPQGKYIKIIDSFANCTTNGVSD